MRYFFAIIMAVGFLTACNNNSGNATTADSISTSGATVDTTAPGSDSVGTKMNMTTNSDTTTKVEQQ
jgi:hypothetical protein